MRVLVVSHLFPNSAGPDHGIWLHRLAAGCRRIGIDVRVVNADRIPGTVSGISRWTGFLREVRGRFEYRRRVLEDVPSVHPSHADPDRLPGALKHLPRLLAARAGVAALRRDGFAPDLVHAVTSYNSGTAALPVARSLGVPLVVTEISSPYTLETSPGYRGRRAREVLRASARVACTSRYMATQVAQAFPEIAAKLEVVYFPAAEPFFAVAPRAREPGPLRLVTAGFLNEQKGLEVMLDALASLAARGKDCTWTVAGDGPLRARLEERARALGLQGVVRFLGRVDNARLAHVLSDAHAYVLSSLHETQGVALIEALAVGLPAVYTRCGGPEEFMTEGDGISAPVGDAAALAAAVAQLDEGYSRFSPARIKERCRAVFGEDACALRMAAVYAEAVDARARATALGPGSQGCAA